MSRSTALLVLRVVTTLYGVALPCVLPASLMSLLAFDGPTSTKNPATVLLVVGILATPCMMLFAIQIAWWQFRCERYRAAVWSLALPLASAALVAIAALWLQVAYGGLLAG